MRVVPRRRTEARAGVRLVNLAGFVVLLLLAVAAFEVSGPVKVWRRPTAIRLGPGPEAGSVEAQLEVSRFYRRPGYLLNWVRPLAPRPDLLRFVVRGPGPGGVTASPLVVDAEAGSPGDGRAPGPAWGLAVVPPAGRAEVTAPGAPTGEWRLEVGGGAGGELRLSGFGPAPGEDRGGGGQRLHTLQAVEGAVEAGLLREQLAGPVARRP